MKVISEKWIVVIEDGITVFRIDGTNATVNRLEVHFLNGEVEGVYYYAKKIRSEQKIQGWVNKDEWARLYSDAVAVAQSGISK